jgi:hypothetical protein
MTNTLTTFGFGAFIATGVAVSLMLFGFDPISSTTAGLAVASAIIAFG